MLAAGDSGSWLDDDEAPSAYSYKLWEEASITTKATRWTEA